MLNSEQYLCSDIPLKLKTAVSKLKLGRAPLTSSYFDYLVKRHEARSNGGIVDAILHGRCLFSINTFTFTDICDMCKKRNLRATGKHH